MHTPWDDFVLVTVAVVAACVFFFSGCSTTSSSTPYFERCPGATWEYWGNTTSSGGEDILMENSGRRACIQFEGQWACLVTMRKLSDVDYLAICRRDASIRLKGNN